MAVVLGVIGVWLGFPLAEPIAGLVISIATFVLLWGTARDIGRRLLDGVDPSLVERAEKAVRSVPGITSVQEVRLPWTGHRLNVDATVTSDPAMPVGRFHELEHQADQIIRSRLSGVNPVRLNPSAHPITIRDGSAVTNGPLWAMNRGRAAITPMSSRPGRMLCQQRLALSMTQTAGAPKVSASR